MPDIAQSAKTSAHVLSIVGSWAADRKGEDKRQHSRRHNLLANDATQYQTTPMQMLE